MIWRLDDVELQRWLADQEERRAQKKEPYKGRERRRWPRVEVADQDDAIDCGLGAFGGVPPS